MDLAAYPLTQRTRNLVRFSRHLDIDTLDASFAANFAFRDRLSRFSLLKSPQTAPGPDECFAHFDPDPRPLFDKLLGLEVTFPGLRAEQAARLAPYNAMNYYRSHIEEIFYQNGLHPLPPLEGTCTMCYAETDRLLVTYRLRNTSATELAVRLGWQSVPADGLGREATVAANGFSLALTQCVRRDYTAHATLTAPDADIAFTWDGSTFRSAPVERTIPAGQALELTFTIDFRFNDEPLAPPRPLTGDAALREAVRDAEEAYARLPELPAIFRPYESLVLKACGTLRTLRYTDTLPEGRRVPTIHAGKCGIAGTWWWDGAFTLLGLGLMGDGATGRGMTALLLAGLRDDGEAPARYMNGQYHYTAQQPILAWGLGHLLRRCPDAAFLRESYAPLARYVRYWMTRWDANGNGLSEYPAGGTCWDDALRWQDRFPIAFAPGERWYEKDWGGSHQELIENVDTNCHLYLECRTLAEMARALGQPDEAATWDRQADALQRLINTALYNPAAGIYQDRSIVDGRFTEMITPSSFMPLYAGIAERDTARRLCRAYLLDPDRFYTALPFPSLDRRHPAFRSGGFLYAPPEHPGSLCQHAYWIGRTWPHVSYWMVGALYEAGLHAEADAAAARILDAMSRSEAIYECYDALTGFGNAHPEFMWSSAAVLALAFRLYARGPLGLATPQE